MIVFSKGHLNKFCGFRYAVLVVNNFKNCFIGFEDN